MRVTAILLAAGQGTRMGPGTDKLFLEVAGKPVVAHTWERFDQAACIDEVPNAEVKIFIKHEPVGDTGRFRATVARTLAA